MSQLNVYVPDDLAKEIRKQARASGESLSKFLSRLFRKQVGKKRGWSKDFFRGVVGRWQGDFPEIQRELPEELDSL